MTTVEFNINLCVYVKLTGKGRAALKANHTEMFGKYPNLPAHSPPLEDADGWSKWQLWDLMSQLGGEHIGMTQTPFEPNIRIEVEEGD